MILGASVTGLAVLIIACVVIAAIFGKKAINGLIRAAAIIFLIYIAWLWQDSWLPWVDPIITTARQAWTQIMAGPKA